MRFFVMIIGNINFTNLKIVLTPATADKVESAILYGSFIQNVVNFLIVAFVVFLMIKGLNSFRKKKEVVPEAPKVAEEIILLSEIRDLLKK